MLIFIYMGREIKPAKNIYTKSNYLEEIEIFFLIVFVLLYFIIFL